MLADRVRISRNKEEIEYIGEVYLAQDDDFVKVNGRWVYRGSELEIEIPHVIQGEKVTSYDYMFYGSGSYLATPVTRVDSNNKMVTSTRYMFYNSSATTLDLSNLDTSNVTNMTFMFYGSSATILDLSNLDTSKVTNMAYMFQTSKATTLDLSSFDTSNVVNMNDMFRWSSATTGYARTQADADRFNASSNKPAGLTFVDVSGIPGPKILIAGSIEEGFFGEVSASEFITGDALASSVGISAGTSQYSTEPWLKFAYKGEIQFVAKKPIRHSISWDAINAAKCVYGDIGDKTVVIGGKTYKVTLMRALEPSNDPKTTANGYLGAINHHSEWNRLMCQIHEEAIDGIWGYPDNIESDIGILEHSLGSGSQGMYSNADLIVGTGTGSTSWCQERGTAINRRLCRGNMSVSHSVQNDLSRDYSTYSWRPVLRLM